MRILVAGATGLVGRELLRQLLADENSTIHALLRRDAALPSGPRLHRHRVDFAALPNDLPAPATVLIALGTTIKVAGSQAAFRAVDFDAVLAVARAARAAGATRCAVVSALGADARSGVFYNRVKGAAEAALRELGFARLVIARPSLLVGDRASLGQPTRRGEIWGARIAHPLAPLIPLRWRPIAAARVARAMLRALAADGAAVQPLESDELQRLGA